MTPFYSRGPVTLYHADGVETGLRLAADGLRGFVLCDAPYSRKVHGKSRAGARKTPLLDGNGHLTRCAIDRAKDFGFAHLTPTLRRGLARAAKALADRWTGMFCDEESAWLWRLSLQAAGMEYVRTEHWHKLCATPQFTGDRPGSHWEDIVFAHAVGPKGKPIKKRWNGGGKGNVRGDYIDDTPAIAHAVQVVQEHRPGCGEPRINETQKPEKLILELLEDYTDPGETVIDLTAGSCTAGIAAIRLGRRFVGVEMREAQCREAAERLDAELDGVRLRPRQAGQMGLNFEGAA